MVNTLQCPECNGSIAQSVLDKPTQCSHCNAWVTTVAGHQRIMRIDRNQDHAIASSIQPTDVAIRPDSPLGRLVGRIKRAAPVIIGVPLAWVLVMHIFVALGWVGIRAVPMGGEDGFTL